MTKTVRIENADTSSLPVRITTQDKVFVVGEPTGEWKDTATQQIDHPTALFTGHLTSTRRFIVEELAAEPVAPAA